LGKKKKGRVVGAQFGPRKKKNAEAQKRSVSRTLLVIYGCSEKGPQFPNFPTAKTVIFTGHKIFPTAEGTQGGGRIPPGGGGRGSGE